MLGTAKETYHQNPGVLLTACTLLLSHQPRHALAARRLASVACYRYYHCCYCHWLPHLEAQA